MQQNNANAKVVFALAAVILLAGIALVTFFLVQPPPAENTQPALEQAETRPTAEAPENSARTATGVSPLLLILIFLVVLGTTTKIGRMMTRRREKSEDSSQ